MELSRQEYPALLATLHPSQASTILNDRIRLINKINSDIADFLQERRRVEETYAQSLRKLASRPQLDNGAALGIFQIPWQRILNATEALAVSHETLATKIEEDVERPLREYSSKNREMQSMPGIQNNLAGLAKNIDAAQKKVDKAKGKGTKGASSLSSAITAAEEMNQQWESRAPFVYEQLQAADEGRLNHLRDVLTQLETHEVDQVERCRQAAESCLNVLLNVETADEIKTFAARMAGSRTPLSPVASRRQNSQAEIPPAVPAAATPPLTAAPLVPPPHIQDDAASQRSERSETPAPAPAAAVATPPAPEPVPRHTPLGGLRRLGTVMNRRKSVIGPTAGSFDRKAEKKHRSPFAPFKRSDSSREMQIPESPPSTADRPGTSLTEESSLRNPSVSHDHNATDSFSPAPIAEQEPSAANGTLAEASAAIVSNGTASNHVDSEGFTERPSTIDEITRAQREAAGLEDSGVNLTIRDQPIFEDESQAKKAMDDMANTLRMRAPQPGMRRNAGTIRGRRDVRNTVFVPNPGTDTGATSATSDLYGPSSPIRHAPSPSTATEDHAMSDTTSVRSGHTMHSLGPGIHPELHEPGLNASILETINAWFSEGKVTKSSVVGELALAHNPVPGAPAGNLRVRLDNFPVLEKVAANPHFVHEVSKDGADEKRGEYEIQLGSISRPMPTVAFKYQVHLDPTNPSAYCPVIFKPAWNLQENQASAIIFYSLNPYFTSATGSITLKNVILTVGLDIAAEDEVTKEPRDSVAHATSAVMYPNSGATFRRKTSTVVWKIPELEVKAPGSGGEDGKFLVRFATATPGPRKGAVEARFELRTTETGDWLGISRASSHVGPKEIDPFADEGKPATPVPWEEVPTARKLVAGKYVSV
ncbi:Fes/CIP4 like proteiny domain protein [Penicillium brasilianum]|uniref:Fes/CIP4 like proteiny domain protein n=1 Tax=Penicillium brasilianum TaxID=104259 RepID=A0A1S9RZT9_PENBI|nr:Fes/CIP4 like proteiny domain protein [Penicillium brasilianum]